jgi:hypothetical protein
MKKRRQHHVWQHYLKPWTTAGQIYCLSDGVIFAANTINVAVERDFYKLQNLTSADISLIRNLILAAAHPLAKRHHEQLLMRLTLPARFVEQNRAQLKNIEQIDNLLDEYQTNALEDYHAGIENSFLPILDDILKGDLSFYSDDDRCIDFFQFICTQHMRTKGVKERSVERVRKHDGQDLSRIWNIAVHMFAFNIGMSLFVERKKRKLVLVENRTDTPFITGDQPIVNLHGDGVHPPDELCFYYPVSPNLALILTEVDKEPVFSTGDLNCAHVVVINAKMLKACHSQVFGRTEAALVALRDDDQQALADSNSLRASKAQTRN